ncbi:MAG: hypothetical protein ACJ735_02885 [Actinomycetes bacterium]
MSSWPDLLRHGRPFLVTALAVSLVAGPLAVLWAHVVPRVGFVLGPDAFAFPPSLDPGFIRADGWFLVMTAIVGALTGVVAWWLTRGESPGAVVGLAVGGVFASYAVARVGMQHNMARLHLVTAAHRFQLQDPLHGHYPPLAHGAVLVWPFFAVVVYGMLALAVVRR